MRVLTVLFMTTVFMVGCSPEPASQGAETNPAAETATQATDPIQAAIANPARSDADRETDLRRKPDQVLAFFQIQPGMTVLDMYSGGGYYTELLSYLVGDDGKVHAHNNSPYLNWLADPIKQRYQPGKLPNVIRFTAENTQLDLPADTFDAVLMIMSYHDIYHVDPENGWEAIDGPAMLAELFQAMKPGSVLGVVDHVATAGAPPETGETLHRIDPELAKAEITAAGFVFEDSSPVLANSEDDHTLHTFSDEIRGKTDQFVFRFRRP